MSYLEKPDLGGPEDEDRSLDTRARLMGLLFLVVLSPVWFLLQRFLGQTRGFVAFCIITVFVAAIYGLKQKALRPRVMVTMAVLLMVELTCALVVPLPEKIFGPTMIGVSMADLLLVMWLLSMVDRTIKDEEGPRYSE